jgi:hypothetical protein
MDIWVVVSGIFGIISVLFGGKLVKIRKAIKEISDVPISINIALADSDISKDELKKIVKESKEAIESIKALF